MPLLAAAAVFAAVFVLLLALGGGEARIRSRLEALRGKDGPGEGDEPQLSFTQRLVTPLTTDFVQTVKRFLPASMVQNMQHQLVLAGEPMTVNTYIGLLVASIATFAVLPLLLVVASGASVGVLAILFMGGFAFAGFLLPNIWLKQRIGARQGQIIKSLPDSFDLITTCVEAGLGLDAALSRVAEKVEGPFADELSRTLREIGLGRSRRDALKELGDRTGVQDLVVFVNAVIQAEQMGSSVGAVLRVQAEQLRVRRRQRAEEQAYKAPVKMIFPLVLCIFPTLFIVILGPAVITIMRDFPGQ